MPFSQKAKKYLLNVCRTGEETSKKCGFSNMEFKRRHRPEMLYRTDWLIEQQLAGYFSRISALTKAGLLKRFSSVSMNKDEEVDADDLVSETDRTRQKIRRDLENLDEDCKGGYCWQLPQAIKKIQTFASHFPLKFIVFTYENNWICPRIFSSREICRKPTGQNIAGSFFESRNSKSVSQRRQHSIARDISG